MNDKRKEHEEKRLKIQLDRMLRDKTPEETEALKRVIISHIESISADLEK
jgi:hypothetical protein